ncbi:MAG: NAD-dependent epimerase/dehydratase [Hyphomicrobiales bacterium]|nr:NAD-dependent epimerase/dehydratase [Hyphomicrobiales bacterium]
MSASPARLALAGPEDTTRPEDIAALARKARELGLSDLRVSLRPGDIPRVLARHANALEQAGVSILVHMDAANAEPAVLRDALKALAAAKVDAVDLTLDPCDLMDEASRAALLETLRSRDRSCRVFVSGPLTRTPARLELLKSCGVREHIDGVVASPMSPQNAAALKAAIEPAELRLQCAPDATLEQVCALQQGPAACLYVCADAPRGLLRLAARSAHETHSPAGLFSPALQRGARTNVIVGGAGFIGCNLAHALASDGEPVRIIDDLARPGVERNLDWLARRHGLRVESALMDIRRERDVEDALEDAGAVFHFAAQVAVTTSLEDPVEDFEVNARGTLNVLEGLRRKAPRTPLVFSSTNKVYGCLEDVPVFAHGERYTPRDVALARMGVDERRPLDLRTPYGCSKGAADQYVLDYAKSFGLRTAVLRMSCIYGPHQFGTEDQGWVAHFLLRAMNHEPITIYGDGLQVRDVLHVADAVDAYRRVLANIDHVRGRAFNLGGGPDNAVSLRRLLREIAQIIGAEPQVRFDAWRSGDQPWFVADTRALQTQLGWRPDIFWRDGLRDLARWLEEAALPSHAPLRATPDLRSVRA